MLCTVFNCSKHLFTGDAVAFVMQRPETAVCLCTAPQCYRYAGCGIKKVAPRIVCSFFGNGFEFQRETLHITYIHIDINTI